MIKTGFVFDEIYLSHMMPEGHPESAERLRAITTSLKSSGLWDKVVHILPRKASPEDISSVHAMKHIERMGTLVGYADPDTYVSEGSYEAALYASGALLEAIDRIKAGDIERAFCAVRPPGHHAEADHAMGFCIFNNVAVGARYAQCVGYKKVFIIDFDVHHGNGTEHLFLDDPSVFYFSTHQYPHYPGTGAQQDTGTGKGEGFTANFPMPAGAGDNEYIHVYRDILPGMTRDFGPDIILVSAGYDLHARDPLAHIRVTDDCIAVIVESIITALDVPAVFTLEGGYSLEALASGVRITLEALMSKSAKSC